MANNVSAWGVEKLAVKVVMYAQEKVLLKDEFRKGMYWNDGSYPKMSKSDY